MNGTVILVGGGPGDPGLLTLRGRDALARADVVVYDALIAPRLLDHAPPEAQRLYVGKRAGRYSLGQDAINALLIEKAREGKAVVRLKGGDPFVFGRGGEEARALAEAGVPFEVVPGVTAGLAAAACAGIPATDRSCASAVTLVTGHEADDREDSALDWGALVRTGGTLIFYMGVGTLPAIARYLVEHGLAPETPAAAIQEGTTPRQRTVTGPLQGLPALVEEAGLAPPAVIVVGPAAGLRSEIAWMERRPLFGRRIVVTRPRGQADAFAARLEGLGAEVVLAPTIRIEPAADGDALAEAAADARDRFDWIIITSVNGAAALLDALADQGRDVRALAGVRVAAIGPATAEALSRRGLRPDLVPSEYTGEAVARTLAQLVDLEGMRVLLPRADIAPPLLAEMLEGAGARVTQVTAYRTLPDGELLPTVAERLAAGTLDWLTFTSASTVENFLKGVGPGEVRASGVRIASIGPSTSAALRAAGLKPAVEADPHTIDGLVAVLVAANNDGRS